MSRIELHQISSTLRFIQGYRFLDRCGEAVINLEERLDSGLIPGELKPTGGTMVNHECGMRARFDSESVSITQQEYLDFDLFLDQSCRTYETLCQTFEIGRMNTPSLNVACKKASRTFQRLRNSLKSWPSLNRQNP